jgi:putative glutamine amidotransferase
MIQDIPLEVYKKKNVEDVLASPSEKQHRNYANNVQDSLDLFWGNIHPIKVQDDSWLVKEGLIYPGQFPGVVSSHHQAVEKTGKDLRIVATSMDGKIIETLDHEKYPNVFGFQFHPEVTDIYNYNNSYQCKPGCEKESLRLMIEKGNGYKFHLALWGKFADVLNEMKK